MKTRKDYLAGNCTHREYYAQFVTESLRNLVKQRYGLARLKKHFIHDDEFGHKDRIELDKWDRAANYVSANFKKYGDTLSLAGQVCILKEAAKQVVEIK